MTRFSRNILSATMVVGTLAAVSGRAAAQTTNTPVSTHYSATANHPAGTLKYTSSRYNESCGGGSILVVVVSQMSFSPDGTGTTDTFNTGSATSSTYCPPGAISNSGPSPATATVTGTSAGGYTLVLSFGVGTAQVTN